MYDDLSYLDYEEDNDFQNWYNIECVQVIKDLSRQIRTLLNYRASVIYHRLRSNEINNDSKGIVKFQAKKYKFESLALSYIKLLNKLKDNGITAKRFQYLLYFRNNVNSSLLKDLVNLTNQLFILIHYFSEENMLLRPAFFKVIMKIAQEACKTRMYLNRQQFEFYEELCGDYKSIENEIEMLNPNPIQQKNNRKKGEMVKL